MSSVDESQSDRSDSETQFSPREDDDETLWEVLEITAEKGKWYKVRWKGIDPGTNEPWAQSWVPKHDCTDDLVRDWKLRQGKKKKASRRDSKKSLASIVTLKSSGSGLTSNTRVSSSKSDRADSTRPSTSTTTPAIARRSKPTTFSPSVQKKITPPLRTRSPSPVSPTFTLSPELNVNAVAASSTSTKTGDKRKHGETTSATTSARIPASSTFRTKGPDSILGSVPLPTKKRKLKVELFNDYERSASSAEVDGKRKLSSRVIESHDDDDDDSDKIVELSTKVRRRNQSQAAEEEEADERMVEESLSDMYYYPRPRSPPQEPSHSQQEEGTLTPSVQAKRPAPTRQVMAEESSPRPQQFPPPPPSPEKSMPDQASWSTAGSERGTKSIPLPVPRSEAGPSPTPSTSIVIPITPPKNTDSGGNDDEYVCRSPILLPQAKKMLLQFDLALTRIESEPIIPDNVQKSREREREEEKGETAVGGGSPRREHGVVRTSEENSVRRSANPRSNSFVDDIIPDSEESQSRSQGTDLQVPAVAHPLVPPLHQQQQGIGVEIPSIIVENPTRASLPRSYSSLENGDGVPRRKAGSRTCKSRSRSRSVTSKNEKEADPEAEIPATASTHLESLQALSQPADSQTESAENHLGAAMHLLNIKSEEISKLEYQLSAEQRKNEDLVEQLSTLHHTESTNDAVTKKLEQELAEARAQLASQKTSWEKERASLVLNIETATRGKVSAEQDRDFFKEQYAKASSFVSSVRDENAELEKQIKIATDQSRSGVSLIKGTFELRIKSLEEDVRAWRRMAEFMIDKDRRTNDDIRRRAGDEPELRARCDRQESVLEDTSERLDQLEIDLEDNQRKLLEAEVVGKRWEEVTVKLNLELIEAKTMLERIGKAGISDDDHQSANSNGHESVYRCRWRPDDSNDVCDAVFLHLSDLQEHLYSSGHLQQND